MAVLSALVAMLSAPGAQASSIWTTVNSGTTDTISAIAYQSPTRFWYATTNGKIEYLSGSSFVLGTGITAGENFVDLAMQPGSAAAGTAGVYGYGVTSNGHIWQTSNGGLSWTQLSAPSTYQDCSAGATVAPESELNGVVWASAHVVYLLGNNSTLMKSLAGDSPSPSFTEINKQNDGTCHAQGTGYPVNLTDAVFLPANPADGFMIQQSFGRVYSTSNGFASGTAGVEMINAYNGNPRIAQDAGNPNRIWAVDHQAGGASCGELCFAYSTDGGVTMNNPKYPQTANGGATPPLGLYDVSSAGGTEVAAGTGGTILNSIDGVNFYNQPASGALASENWHAEDGYDAQHAAVGGEGGALAVTAAANTIPDIVAPTGTISGPTTVTSGQTVTYTANVADNTGGSGINPNGYTWTVPGFPAQHGATASYAFPSGAGSETITLTFTDNAGNQGTATLNVTVNNAPPPGPPSGSGSHNASSGGAQVTLYKQITVTGRKGRFIPVPVTVKHGRIIVVTIQTTKGKRIAGPVVTVFTRPGRKTIHVGLSSKVTAGHYRIVIAVESLNGKSVGKKIRALFLLV